MAISFRVANYDTPFWVGPNRSAGRYNREMEGPTQYLSLHPLGCAAEYLRGQDLRRSEEILERMVRIWVVEIDLRDAGELSFASAADHGLAPDDLVSEGHAACQRWADAVRTDGSARATWIVPSAALPGTDNVVIFGERILSPFSSPPIDPIVDLPATIVGDLSLLPSEVIPQVRFRGDPHPAFDAWQRGDRYQYRDPASYPLPL